MHVICGLPRSGSTLYCNVLNQNPELWASSTSILPSLCATLVHAWSISPELKVVLSGNREETEERLKDILRTVCEKWHGDKEGRLVFDKSRAWSHNLLMLYSIYPDAKVIVTVRDLREVFASIEKQHRRTGFLDEASDLKGKTIFDRADNQFSPEGVIGAPLKGIKDILDRRLPVHWVKYESFAKSPEHAMAKLYEFLNCAPYGDHDFNNVEGTAEDPDWLYLHKFPHEGTGRIEPSEPCWQKYMSDEIGDMISKKFDWFQEEFGYKNPDARPRRTG